MTAPEAWLRVPRSRLSEIADQRTRLVIGSQTRAYQNMKAAWPGPRSRSLAGPAEYSGTRDHNRGWKLSQPSARLDPGDAEKRVMGSAARLFGCPSVLLGRKSMETAS